MAIKTLDFVSRVCRQELHKECQALWEGLGFLVACACTCHNSKSIEKIGGRRGDQPVTPPTRKFHIAKSDPLHPAIAVATDE